jgi:hypothetical protein
LAAAEALCRQDLHAIYTSDERRAIESSAPLERLTGIVAVRRTALRERGGESRRMICARVGALLRID